MQNTSRPEQRMSREVQFSGQVEHLSVTSVWGSCRRQKYALEVTHFLRNPQHLAAMERASIEEDRQAVSRKRSRRKYIYLMVFELAHADLPAGPFEGHRPFSESPSHFFADLTNARLVAPEEPPPFDLLGPNQAGIGQNLQMLGCSRGADLELFPDVISTNAVLNQITISLGGEVTPWMLEQIKHCQAGATGQGLERGNQIQLAHLFRYFV